MLGRTRLFGPERDQNADEPWFVEPEVLDTAQVDPTEIRFAHIGGVEVYYGGYCHVYIKKYQAYHKNKEIGAWRVPYMSAQLLVNWKAAVRNMKQLRGCQVIMFVDYIVHRFQLFARTAKAFIHAFDAYSDAAMRGEHTFSTDYMATAVCSSRGFSRAKKGSQYVNHSSLWVCPQLIECAPPLALPHFINLSFTDTNFKVIESFSDYKHAAVHLGTCILVDDGLFDTFNDASFRQTVDITRPAIKQIVRARCNDGIVVNTKAATVMSGVSLGFVLHAKCVPVPAQIDEVDAYIKECTKVECSE